MNNSQNTHPSSLRPAGISTAAEQDDFSFGDYLGLFAYSGPPSPGILGNELVTVAA